MKHPIYFKYEISDHGRIRNISSKRILKQYNRLGYCQITSTCTGKRKTLSVHRLVAESFLGLSDKMVNHLNSDPSDNRLENLEFCSASENVQHCLAVGRGNKKFGTEHGSNKFSVRQVLSVKKALSNKMRPRDIVKQTGVSRHMVYLIAKGRAWNCLENSGKTLARK